MKFKRIFLLVMDSVGAGMMDDAYKFNDEGASTLVHISQKVNGLKVPTLNYLGLYDCNNDIKLIESILETSQLPGRR